MERSGGLFAYRGWSSNLDEWIELVHAKLEKMLGLRFSKSLRELWALATRMCLSEVTVRREKGIYPLLGAGLIDRACRSKPATQHSNRQP